MNADIYNELLYYAFIVLGLGIIIFAIFKKASKNQLKENGVETEGIIFTQGRNSKISNVTDSNYANDSITVRFVTDKKEWITSEIDQGFQIFYTGQYKNGEKVKLYYDKENPSNFFVDTKQSELSGRLFLAIGGLCFAAVGIYYTFFA